MMLIYSSKACDIVDINYWGKGIIYILLCRYEDKLTNDNASQRYKRVCLAKCSYAKLKKFIRTLITCVCVHIIIKHV